MKNFCVLFFLFFFVNVSFAQNHDLKRGDNAKQQLQKVDSHKGHNHALGDHSGHDHGGHDHSGHDHSGHDHSGHDHSGHDHAKSNKKNHQKGAHSDHGHDQGHHSHVNACGDEIHDHSAVFNPGAVAFHHISDHNVYSIGPLQFSLPCILYTHGGGVDFFSSGRFDADYHGIGRKAYNGYVLYEGQVKKILGDFPSGEVELGDHAIYAVETEVDGKKKDKFYTCLNGTKHEIVSKSTLDAGLFGGGITTFTDFSLTKNVVSMLIVCLFLFFMFRSIAKAYKTREGQAPKGVQSLMEPIIVFIQDEVAKPILGDKYMRFLPLLLTLFFFILGLNLFGQVPFFGGSNVTGNLSVTLVLAVIAFVVTNVNGNKDYFKHIFNMPGLPGWVKTIVTPVEFMGMFIKPLTLMLRLFGNITAGHMVIVIFVGLIFIFGQNGANAIAGWGTAIVSTLLTLFMMSIELLVAFIQAYVFTLLTASYIGSAVEEHDDHH